MSGPAAAQPVRCSSGRADDGAPTAVPSRPDRHSFALRLKAACLSPRLKGQLATPVPHQSRSRSLLRRGSGRPPTPPVLVQERHASGPVSTGAAGPVFTRRPQLLGPRLSGLSSSQCRSHCLGPFVVLGSVGYERADMERDAVSSMIGGSARGRVMVGGAFRKGALRSAACNSRQIVRGVRTPNGRRSR
jgi:hypothetical protein